jgi:phosphoribosylaminoimidazolecarboxamide formyltransferase/IMP cyclohydrolase
MTDLAPIKRALISVSDKTGLVELGRALQGYGVEVISTGGSAKALRDAGVAVSDVADITGFPEMMDGRVKTLHPMVHGGLLALRDDAGHQQAMRDHGIAGIDLLVVNLYPFEATVAGGADYATAIENIDIGGPAMIRAAAKNHAFVTTLVDPAQYQGLLDELAAQNGQTCYGFRQSMALAAYGRTAVYDAAVSNWMAQATDTPSPAYAAFGGQSALALRYGENPHQAATFYRDGSNRPGVATARQIQGKALSYNNINDTNAAFELVAEFHDQDRPACVIVKHANPCGVALGDSLAGAYQRAFDCDRTSAFGGIVAFNRALDADTAALIVDIFTEVVIAPGATPQAQEVLAKQKNLRLLITDGLPDPKTGAPALRQVAGGYLVQSPDTGFVTQDQLTCATQKTPSAQDMADLLFAWRVAKHVKSNAIVYAKNGQTVGIGAGQMSRVDSARIAGRKAADMMQATGATTSPTQGAVMASDAFLPFADGLDAAIEAGIAAVIQPGGSIRDAEVIETANRAGLAMVFTGMRHFRH